MLVSELIDGLKQVLTDLGDLEVCYAIQHEEEKQIQSIPIVYGGAGHFGPDQAMVAFVSSSEKIKELFEKVE